MIRVLTVIQSLLVSLLVICIAKSAGAITLAEVDQILMNEAPNLESLLRSTSAQDAYYRALAQYFGPKRFQRQAFDSILVQLFKVSQKIPTLGERLWREPEGRSYVILTDLRSAPLYLHTAKLQSLREKMERRLTDCKSCDEPTFVFRLEEFHQELVSVLKRLDDEGQSQKYRRQHLAQVISQLKSRPEFVQVGTSLAYHKLLENHFFDMRTDEALLAIHKLGELRKTADHLGARAFPLLRSVLTEFYPSLEMLQERGILVDAFGNAPAQLEKVGKETWTARAVPRGIHAVFDGIAQAICVSGDVEKLDQLHPVRWALSALKGTRTQFLERNGEFHGSLKRIHIQIRGEFYESLDMVAPELEKTAIVYDGQGRISQKTIFQAWYEQALSDRIPGSQGYVVPSGETVHNGRAPAIFSASSVYVYGEFLGHNSFNPSTDHEFGLEIAHSVPLGAEARKMFASGMMYATNVQDAGDLIRLSIKPPIARWYDDAEKLHLDLDVSMAPRLMARVLGYFALNPPQNPQVEKVLKLRTRELISQMDLDHSVLSDFNKAANSYTFQALFRYSPQANGARAFPAIGQLERKFNTSYSAQGLRRFNDELILRKISYTNSYQKLLELRHDAQEATWSLKLQLAEKLLSRASNVGEFLHTLIEEDIPMFNELRPRFHEFVMAHLDEFLRRQPTEQQLHKLTVAMVRNGIHPSVHRQYVSKVIPFYRQTHHLLDLILPRGGSKQDLVEYDTMISENLETLLTGHQWTPEQLIKLRQLAPDSDSQVKILERALQLSLPSTAWEKLLRPVDNWSAFRRPTGYLVLESHIQFVKKQIARIQDGSLSITEFKAFQPLLGELDSYAEQFAQAFLVRTHSSMEYKAVLKELLQIYGDLPGARTAVEATAEHITDLLVNECRQVVPGRKW